MQITMVGTGYVGLVTGTCLAEIGHHVTCVDVDEGKISRLKEGVAPIYEPGIEDMIHRNQNDHRLFFTTDLATALEQAEVAFIAVGTPEGEDGSADLKYVMAVAEAIGEGAQGDLMVVVKSTVPVGTGDLVEEAIQAKLKARGVSYQISVASNPEFLKEGDAIKDFMRPDRIVVGVNCEEEKDVFDRVYHPFVIDDPTKLLVMDRRSSELTKYGANAMLATRISFMNELSRLCEKLGANVDHIRRGMGSDPRIGKKFLYAGPGYGGSCFPKDVEALLKTGEKAGIEFSVLSAVSKTNRAQKELVAQKIKNHFQDLKGKSIAVWGLAFKPGTDDVREAPAKTIIDQLLLWGATVKAHDPKAIESFSRYMGQQDGLTYTHDAYDALSGSDALVLITEWAEYRRPDWVKIKQGLKQPVIFDLRNQYESAPLQKQGFHYQCVGRPDSVHTYQRSTSL